MQDEHGPPRDGPRGDPTTSAAGAPAGPAPPVSVAAAARQLGVSRWTVLRRMATGELEAAPLDLPGRRIVQVRPATPVARTRPVPLPATAVVPAEQMQQIAATLERLSRLLVEAHQERIALRALLARHGQAPVLRADLPEPPPAGRDDNLPDDDDAGPLVIPPVRPPRFDRVPVMRPNPMTHPVELFPSVGARPRDDVLEPVRVLYRLQPRHWWQRLPIMNQA